MKEKIIGFILLIVFIIVTTGGAIGHGLVVQAQRDQVAQEFPALAILSAINDIIAAAAQVAGGGQVGVNHNIGEIPNFVPSSKGVYNKAMPNDASMLVNALINDNLVKDAGLDIYLKQIRDGKDVNIDEAIMHVKNKFPEQYDFFMKFKKDRRPVHLELSGIPDFKMVLEEYKRFKSKTTSGGKRKNRTHKRKLKRN